MAAQAPPPFPPPLGPTADTGPPPAFPPPIDAGVPTPMDAGAPPPMTVGGGMALLPSNGTAAGVAGFPPGGAPPGGFDPAHLPAFPFFQASFDLAFLAALFFAIFAGVHIWLAIKYRASFWGLLCMATFSMSMPTRASTSLKDSSNFSR
jgi:hypothetical protein